MNLENQGLEQPIALIQKQISSDDLSFIEYFVPGVIGIAIMSTGVFGTIGTNTKYKKNGVIKKNSLFLIQQYYLQKIIYQYFSI